MARLEPSFPLLSTDANRPILGVIAVGSHVLVTTLTSVDVFDSVSQKTTRTFTLPKGRTFSSLVHPWTTSPIERETEEASSDFTVAAHVDDELWRWPSDAASTLNDGVEKTTIRTITIDEAVSSHLKSAFPPIPSLKGGVVVFGVDEARLISSSPRETSVRGSQCAFLDARVRPTSVHIIDVASGTSTNVAFPPNIHAEASRIFLRRRTVCVSLTDRHLVNIARSDGDGRDDADSNASVDVPKALSRIRLDAEVRLLTVDSEKDVAFVLRESAESGRVIEVVGLRFGSVLAFQPINAEDISADVEPSFLLGTQLALPVDGFKVISFPCTVLPSVSSLSLNLAKRSSNGGGTLANWYINKEQFLKSASSPNTEIPTTQSQLNKILKEKGSVRNRSSVLDSIISAAASSESAFFPSVDSLDALCKSGVLIGVWSAFIEVILSRQLWSHLLVALSYNEGARAEDLCAFLKLIADGVVPETFEIPILDAVVTHPSTDDDVRRAIRSTLDRPRIVHLLRMILRRLRTGAGRGDVESEDAPREKKQKKEEGNRSKSISPSLTNRLLHWASLIVDAAFVDLSLAEDASELEALAELRSFTDDLEHWLETVHELRGLVDGGAASASESSKRMSEEDEYGVFLMCF